MRLRVSDITADSFALLARTWLDAFGLCGNLVSFGLHSDQPSILLSIREAWSRLLGAERHFFVDWSKEYPRLLSLYAHVTSATKPGSDSAELAMAGIRDAWAAATTIALAAPVDVHVVSQSFVSYGNPTMPSSENCLAKLCEALHVFMDSTIVGNLGHPASDHDERVFEMHSSGIDVPFEERYVWESDLSMNSVELVFQAGPDSSNRATEMELALGRHWDNGLPDIVVEWVREVRWRGDVVGKEVLALAAATSTEQCPIVPEAARFFGLGASSNPFSLVASSKDKKALSGFAPLDTTASTNLPRERHVWPVPHSSSFGPLLSIAVRFMAK